ncbi:hypothetical protein MXB_3549, partial [Myxobolus squamalis]
STEPSLTTEKNEIFKNANDVFLYILEHIASKEIPYSLNDLALYNHVDTNLKPYIIHIIYKNLENFDKYIYRHVDCGYFPLNRLRRNIIRNRYANSVKIDFERVLVLIYTKSFDNAVHCIDLLSNYLNNEHFFSKSNQANFLDAKIFSLLSYIIQVPDSATNPIYEKVISNKKLTEYLYRFRKTYFPTLVYSPAQDYHECSYKSQIIIMALITSAITINMIYFLRNRS